MNHGFTIQAKIMAGATVVATWSNDCHGDGVWAGGATRLIPKYTEFVAAGLPAYVAPSIPPGTAGVPFPASPNNMRHFSLSVPIAGIAVGDQLSVAFSQIDDGVDTNGRCHLDNVLLNATGAAGTTYASWASANGISANPSDDSNNDGVTNGVAYFMNVTGLATNPAINGTTKQVTWPNGGNIPSGQYGTQFVVQISSDLQTWTDVPVGNLDTNSDYSAGPPAVDGSLSYTLTGASPSFARLKVTPN